MRLALLPCAVAFALVAELPLLGQDPENLASEEAKGSGTLLNRGDRVNGGTTRDLFDRSLVKARPWIVKIYDRNNNVICLGTIVTTDGYVVTKASEVTDRNLRTLSVQVHDKSVRKARLASVQKDNDIALLKLETAGKLEPVVWAGASDLPIGTWVGAASHKKAGGFYGGILSARTRKIERAGGALGISLEPDPDREGVLVSNIFENGGARKAGMERGDVVLSIDGEPTTTPSVLQELVKKHHAGDKIRILLRRNRGTLEFDVRLTHRSIVFDMLERNQRMSGKTSNRKTGFDRVLQHDMSLAPEAMGGPLLLLNGKAIGINIARVDRVTSYSLPIEIARPIIDQLVTAHRALD